MILRDDRLRALGLGLLSLLGLLVAGELLVRALVDPPRPPYPPEGGRGPERDKKDPFLTDDPDLFWKPKPNTQRTMPDPVSPAKSIIVRTNALGLRSPEFPARKTGAHYWILVLGNSPVWGERISGEETFTAVLEKKLAAKTKNLSVEALNAGMQGYSTFQSRELERRLLDSYRFDLVVISLMGGDWIPGPRPDKDMISPAVRRFLSRSGLYRYLSSLLRSGSRSPEYGPRSGPRVPVGDYENNLTDMVRLAQAQKAEVVLLAPLPICMEEDCLGNDPGYRVDRAAFRRLYAHMGTLEPQYRDAMSRVAARTGAHYLDLEDRLRDSPSPSSLYADVTHPNAAGHRLIAAALAPLAEGLMRRRVSEKGKDYFR